MAVYEEYRLWYVPPDVIAFAHKLVVGMSVALGSRANVRECFKLFEVIPSTRFEKFPSSWRVHISRSVDHHHGCTGVGGDIVYYDPWQRRKIDDVTTPSRVSASHIVPTDVNVASIHDEEDTLHVPRDASFDFVPGQGQAVVDGDPA